MDGTEPAQMSRLHSTPPGITLGALDLIPSTGARNFVVQFKAGRFHGFVVRREQHVFGYVDRCPHMGLSLAQELDRYLTEDSSLITCSWHGALFEADTGQCVAGPCRGARLTEWPVHVCDSFIVTGPPPAAGKQPGRCRHTGASVNPIQRPKKITRIHSINEVRPAARTSLGGGESSSH